MRSLPHRLVRALSLALAIFLAATAPSHAQGMGLESESEFSKAVATARSTLPHFWERLSANEPHETGYALKIAASDQYGTEQLWVTRLQSRGKRLYGIVDTPPRVVRFVRKGHDLEIRTESIVDWMYFRNGRMVGNHTGRVLLRYLPPAEAEKLLLLYE
jgi:uncharacterized protein YegJ (DUF2314 family)